MSSSTGSGAAIAVRTLSGAQDRKWTLVGRNIVAAIDRVALDEDSDEESDSDSDNRAWDGASIEGVVTRISDLFGADHIVIYSGVHGDPHGLIQINDPDFETADVEAFEQDGDPRTSSPEIEVKTMTCPNNMNDPMPAALRADLDDQTQFIVLAWCYSAQYLKLMGYRPPGR